MTTPSTRALDPHARSGRKAPQPTDKGEFTYLVNSEKGALDWFAGGTAPLLPSTLSCGTAPFHSPRSARAARALHQVDWGSTSNVLVPCKGRPNQPAVPTSTQHSCSHPPSSQQGLLYKQQRHFLRRSPTGLMNGRQTKSTLELRLRNGKATPAPQDTAANDASTAPKSWAGSCQGTTDSTTPSTKSKPSSTTPSTPHSTNRTTVK